MTELGADPFLTRLRDALGVLRIAYLVAEGERERTALTKAGEAVSGAMDVASSRRREKELGHRLRSARCALRDAARAVPTSRQVLWGAFERMPRMRGYR